MLRIRLLLMKVTCENFFPKKINHNLGFTNTKPNILIIRFEVSHVSEFVYRRKQSCTEDRFSLSFFYLSIKTGKANSLSI